MSAHATAHAAAADMGSDAEPARAPWQGVFALKVDVDTRLGLRDGAPRLLELLAHHGVQATFFVAMGPDRTGLSIRRVLRQKGFLAKMVRSRAPSLYPLETMLRGTLLPSAPIVARQPERVREIDRAGHELGVHGWDHVRWHDELADLAPAVVAAEIERAAALFDEVLGRRPQAFAAPGWQCTGESLRAVDRAGFRYRSDTRGDSPYRPQAGGYVAGTAELPTTLPTLDELLGRVDSTPAAIAAEYAARLRPNGLNVHTIHTEVEGGPCLQHLDELLVRVRDRMPVVTLGEIAAMLPPVERLPVAAVAPGRLPGRGGTVACQVPA
ncbi:MAG TPA: polysaccharide deacetylase family protein [Candidatus Binatia bacterium]|nr:polysaccharide deacetylase family protein [Candidatus Binatia bacterium]